MLKIRLAADTGPFAGDLRTTLDRIRELSMGGVELDLLQLMPLEDYTRTAVREIRKHLNDRDLSLVVTRLRLPRGLDDPEGLEQRLDQIRRGMDLTYQLGGRYISYKIGYITNSRDTPEWQILREVVRDLCYWGERYGAILAVETGFDPPDDVNSLLDGLPDGTIAVDLNPGEFLMHGFDPVAAVEKLGRWAGVFHATDATSRPGGRGYRLVPLGQGNVDYPAVLSALENSGYQGHLVLRPTGDGDPLAELRQGKDFLYRL